MQDTQHSVNPTELERPCRKITGMSAILLPFDASGQADWGCFSQHVERTFNAGLTPAVNMDTGYANLIDEATRRTALEQTQAIAAGRDFVAGAYVGDQPGDAFNRGAYAKGIEQVTQHGGTPILFQSFGLTEQSDEQILASYQTLAADCDRIIGFELGTMFAPFGKIYSLELYEQWIQIPQLCGAKHSSLQRTPEWQRLEIRDRVRTDFMVLTGNDLAIDMVRYGSDYLLGLSTFAPEAFARRDAYWESGDARFYELNDLLQYLGEFAFREPTPAYKHSAAMFLKQRDWIATDKTHPKSPPRPESDQPVLAQILARLEVLMEN